MNSFFQRKLGISDRVIFDAVRSECRRQQNQIELIASENIVSPAVLEAQGTVFTNKYAEGYPGRRYYGGCEYADVIESVAIDRVKQLFGSKFANVQPHSGAQANGAAFLAVLKPGDTFLGLSLDAGGHLTHGAKPTVSGKWFNAVSYGVHPDSSAIDFDAMTALAKEHKPKLIIAGGSAYPRALDFRKFREIADAVGALLMVDMAHIAGLVAGGAHSNPLDCADIVTSTTHKTLRGPRGGIIMTNDPALAKKIDSAVFPGMQGGPLMHVIAAKAVAFGEALQPEFKTYAHQMIANTRALADSLRKRGFDLVAGGTDTHLLLVDLRSKGLTGNIAEQSLERAHLTCNKNGIPFDPQKPSVTSGIRLGSAVGTTRGFREAEFELVGSLIADVLDGLTSRANSNAQAEDQARKAAIGLCEKFPIYSEDKNQ